MDSHEVFLRAIVEDPDNVALRLIYADWLDEQGDPRGELIRVQCEMAQLGEKDPRYRDLHARSKELEERERTFWFGYVRDISTPPMRIIDVSLARGLPYGLSLKTSGIVINRRRIQAVIRKDLRRVLSLCPIQCLDFTNLTSEVFPQNSREMLQLLAVPGFEFLQKLTLPFGRSSSSFLPDCLLESSHLRKSLRCLHFIQATDTSELPGPTYYLDRSLSSGWIQLQELHLSYLDVVARASPSLYQSKCIEHRLRALKLFRCNLGRSVVNFIDFWSKDLRLLSFQDSRADLVYFRALSDGDVTFPNLYHLNLSGFGAEWVKWEFFPELRELVFHRASQRELAPLLQPLILPKLKTLDIRGTQFSEFDGGFVRQLRTRFASVIT